MPVPASGQVLVQVHFAPLNPSDIANLKGAYASNGIYTYSYPLAGGNEGSGTVVKSGGGMMANRLVGQKVAMARTSKDSHYSNGGTYA